MHLILLLLEHSYNLKMGKGLSRIPQVMGRERM